jgi:CBS domain-containing membrane protein
MLTSATKFNFARVLAMRSEEIRISLGALIGLLITGVVCRMAFGSVGDLPALVAPLGASTVLLFAAPQSPLARPWCCIGGNTISALVGVTIAGMIADPIIAAAVACAIAIGVMMALGCLHPPGGAVALTAVLGGPSIQAAGYGFAIWPIGVSSLLLLGAALAFNHLMSRVAKVA